MMTEQEKKAVLEAAPLYAVYVAARDVIDYMDRNSGACTGQLLQRLRNALVETDELQIPEFLRRKQPKESNSGLEDLL